MSPRKTVLALLSMCLAVACGGAPDDPAEEVAEIRSGYTAELNGFAVRQVPLTEDPEAATGEAVVEDAPDAGQEDAETGAEEGAAAEGSAAEDGGAQVPLRQDVILDILVSRTGRESLPGITVDIEHVGPEPDRAVKETYRAYIDASQIFPGGGTQVVHRLEDVDYEDGDGFHVEIRQPVSPEERGEYREFQEYQASGQGQP